MTSHKPVSYMADHQGAPLIGAGFLAAGLIPDFFTANSLQIMYFLVVIPPAAWHLCAWFRKDVIPTVKKWFDIPEI